MSDVHSFICCQLLLLHITNTTSATVATFQSCKADWFYKYFGHVFFASLLHSLKTLLKTIKVLKRPHFPSLMLTESYIHSITQFAPLKKQVLLYSVMETDIRALRRPSLSGHIIKREWENQRLLSINTWIQKPLGKPHYPSMTHLIMKSSCNRIVTEERTWVAIRVHICFVNHAIVLWNWLSNKKWPLLCLKNNLQK